jgi:hypothetical protein
MVATPGDPRNGVDMGTFTDDVAIDIAYGGSCTGGKKADMDMYALVLGKALAKGKKVAPGVKAYIQFGSQHIRRYAEAKGYVKLFTDAGVELIDPSCGACIKAGPGVSDKAERHGERDQPQLPRPLGPRKGLPREPADGRRERHRRQDRRPRQAPRRALSRAEPTPLPPRVAARRLRSRQPEFSERRVHRRWARRERQAPIRLCGRGGEGAG